MLSPAELERIISRCLRKDPDRRAQHAGDIQLALEDCTSGKVSRASQPGDQAAAAPEEQPAMMRKLFGSAAPNIPALGNSAHQDLFALRLARVSGWAVQNVTGGTWSLALFFSTLFSSTIQSIRAAVLLFAGSMTQNSFVKRRESSRPGFARSGWRMVRWQ